jgi:hypothetical protein
MCKTAHRRCLASRLLLRARTAFGGLLKLTPDNIRAIAPVPPKTEIIVFDDEVPGFGVRTHLSGSKVFIVQYSIGNKQRRMSLGKIEMLEVDTARQKAKEILTAVRMGQDPAGRQK